jgi:urease accessory protein
MTGIATMKRIALLATFALAGAAQSSAHTAAEIGSGFLHPLLGIDHLLAMLAVGAWAAMLGRNAIGAIPGAFVLVMAFGYALAGAGVALPLVEATVLVSVLVLGVLLLARIRMSVWAGMALAGLFALAHGQAHGAALPADSNFWIFGFGLVSASALLQFLGAMATWIALQPKRPWARSARPRDGAV